MLQFNKLRSHYMFCDSQFVVTATRSNYWRSSSSRWRWVYRYWTLNTFAASYL